VICTFYSYKGGVGRSMALANIAELLIARGLNVLMIDWDLEAPGLERYFPVGIDTALEQSGVADMILDYKQLLATPQPSDSGEEPNLRLPDLRSYMLEIYPKERQPHDTGELWLMPAGRRMGMEFDRYGQFVRTFDWQDFYQNWEGESFIEWFRRQADTLADAVLIDSRTGVTELGGICTYQLADAIVMFCATNSQSLDGTADMAARFTDPGVIHLRRDRPLHVLVVPARVEDRAEARDLSRFRDAFLDRFGKHPFVGQSALAATAENLWELKVPHVPYYAFREAVVVRDPESVRHPDMYEAFCQLADQLASLPGVDWPTRTDAEMADVETRVDKVRARATADSIDFFISYAADDRGWAEWIAWQLEAAGYRTALQAWDFAPGDDFVSQMAAALSGAKRILVVLSPAYAATNFAAAEWQGALARDPTGTEGRLLPVRVAPMEPPGLLATRIYLDLVGVDEASAATRLLEAVRGGKRGKPSLAPAFPPRTGRSSPGVWSVEEPRFPGQGPEIFNVPPPNPTFTGRADLLQALRHKLAETTAVHVAAVHGLGGVGKTQLAIEYAHRYAAEYNLIWWIWAEQAAAIKGQLVALARRLGIPEYQQSEVVITVLWNTLAARDRWLLVYDNAQDPAELAGLRPPAGGHVLITSRNRRFGQVAVTLAVDVWREEEAAQFLLTRTSGNDRQAALALAAELGGFPLALAQAAAYIEQTGLDLGGYLYRYRTWRRELLTHGSPVDYPATVATTWQLSIAQVQASTPTAVELLRLCAMLAPDAIPLDLLAADPTLLPAELAAVATDALGLDEAVGALLGASLATRDHHGLRVHRLVQAVVYDSMADQAGEWAERAVRLLQAAMPEQPEDPRAWPQCEVLLSHAEAAAGHAQALGVAAEPTGRLLDRVGVYLWSRAELPAAHAHLERALAIEEAALGPDHPAVATTLTNLGVVLEGLGDLAGARAFHQRALAIEEAALGPDHPAVARTLGNLGLVQRALGDLAGARAFHQRALAIEEAALGPDHPAVATILTNLGVVLEGLGDLAGARAFHQRALAIEEGSPRSRPS
jgi:Tfp pilus assembly protein PilF